MHCWAGHMLPVTTPIENIYNVGDACAPPGTIGTEGAAGPAYALCAVDRRFINGSTAIAINVHTSAATPRRLNSAV